MIYNKLYINIIIRVTLITLTCLGLAFSIAHSKSWLVLFYIIALLILQIVLFVRSLNKINNDLETFFTALENNDTSIALRNYYSGTSYRKLAKRLNLIKQKIIDLRIENEKQFQYFKTVVENIGTGLIICDAEGKIELVNDAGQKILAVGKINHLNQLDMYFPELASALLQLSSEKQVMIRLNISNIFQFIAFKVSDYRFLDHSIRLITFQNIKNELDAQELESWQKLIRVLTHEIMNSTGPITSSIDTIKEFLTNEETHQTKKIEELNQETLIDIIRGIDIIKERSIGLSEFVQNFRSLTIKPSIKPEKFEVITLVDCALYLLKEELKTKQINLEITVLPKNMELFADRKLIEQVIINLLYNAMDAMENRMDKKLIIKAFKSYNNKPIIQVIDNGKGIADELLDKIFIPFFTTSEKGSGIGLSISRQIMQMHGGSITVKSKPEEKTVFELFFEGNI